MSNQGFTLSTVAQLPLVIRAYRKMAGLTQKQLAERLNVTQQAVSDLERNADQISISRLMLVLSVLGAQLNVTSVDVAPAHTLNGDQQEW